MIPYKGKMKGEEGRRREMEGNGRGGKGGCGRRSRGWECEWE
jgi:hypothetical protein